MRKPIHLTFFAIVLVATAVSLAQNPPSIPGQPPAAGNSQGLPPANTTNPANGVPPQSATAPPPNPELQVQVPDSKKAGANNQAPTNLPPPNAVPGKNSSAAKPPAANVAPAEPGIPDNDLPVFQNPEGYHYDPTGRRDPFKPYGESQTALAPENPDAPTAPPEPLQNFDISQYRLLGIIWQVRDPKAMVLDPTGKTHLIRKQTKIGRNNGFVAAIREGEVIIVEPSVGENGVQTAVTRIMNLK